MRAIPSPRRWGRNSHQGYRLWHRKRARTASLNLSQAYRDWGLAEIESNRDFYGSARFDDMTFQLSSDGQALQSRFVAQYAEALQKGISAGIALHDGPLVSRSISSSEQTVRELATIGGAVSTSPNQAPAEQISEEVASARMEGRSKIESNRRTLEELTRGANGASAQSADAIKDWER
jgi:conjugal transfer mating pair stabilization protein TraG